MDNPLLTKLLWLAMGAVCFSLISGLIMMMRGKNGFLSNRLMQGRVIFQGIVILIFSYLLWKSRG